MGALADEAERLGVRIAVESHMGTLHDTVAGLDRLLGLCSNKSVQVCLDFANLLVCEPGLDLSECIRHFSGHIGYVHIKNNRGVGAKADWSVPVRMGEIDYRRLLPVLEQHYDGVLGVEYCGEGDPDWVVADDAKYLLGLALC